MAYGMLTSFGLGALQGLGNAVVNKLSRDQEAELKDKAEAEREARIEEAKIRAEQRAQAYAADPNNPEYKSRVINDQVNQARLAQLNQENSPEAQAAARAKHNAEIAESDYKSSPEYWANKREQDRLAIESTKTNIASSNNAIENQNIARQISRIELANKQEISDLRNQLKTETDPTTQDKLYNRLLILEGKSTKPSFETIDVGIYNDKGEQVKDENGVPKFKKQLISIDPISQKINYIGQDTSVKYNAQDAKSIAIAEADDKFGRRNWTMFDTKNDKDNTKEYDNYVKSRTAFWTGQDKSKSGMLNSKGANKNSSIDEAPFKATDDPSKQKEYDIIFNKVVKPHESGNDGVKANNPESSAGGTWQLLDDTAIQFGAKKDSNGKVSNAEKDRVAPKYYEYVYKLTDGDPAAMLAANFGQEAVGNAMGRAETKGTKWYDELKNPKLIKNMPEVYIRAKESIAELKAAGIEPDPRLLDFVNNYTSTKTALTKDSASTIKRL